MKKLLRTASIVAIGVCASAAVVAAQDGPPKIGMTFQEMNYPYFVSMQEALNAAAKTLGSEVVVTDANHKHGNPHLLPDLVGREQRPHLRHLRVPGSREALARRRDAGLRGTRGGRTVEGHARRRNAARAAPPGRGGGGTPLLAGDERGLGR